MGDLKVEIERGLCPRSNLFLPVLSGPLFCLFLAIEVVENKNKDGTVREYLQIVEINRVDGKTQQKVICTLGRLDELREGELDRLIDSLAKYTKRRAILDGAQELFAAWSKEYGADPGWIIC